MPWTKSDAKHKTHKASTPKKQRQWAHIANSALASGDSEASAIKQANAVIARTQKRLDRTFKKGKK